MAYPNPFQTLSVSGAGPAPGATGATPQVLSVQLPTADTVSCNGGTNVFATTYTFPAGSLGANSVYRITLGFKRAGTNTTVTEGFTSTLGGANVCSFNQVATGGGVSARGTGITILLSSNTAPNNTANVTAIALIPPGPQASLIPFSGETSVGPTPNVNTNSSLVFQCGLSSNATNANNSLQMTAMIVEQLQ